MKSFTILASAVFIFYGAVLTASGQRTSTPPRQTRPAVVTTNTIGAATIQADAQKVSNQVVNVTKFLYLLGGAAKGIEDIDKDPKANSAAKSQNAENKQALMRSIANLRAGLAALEVEFRTKPALRKFLPKIEGITAFSGQCEDLALAGRFSDAGRPLVSVVEKLSDTLVAMP